MSFTTWLSEGLRLSSRTRGLNPRRASRRRTPTARRTFTPRLEHLDDRCVPSTLRVNHDFNIHAAADETTVHGTLPWAVANAHNGDTILLTGNAASQGITLTQGELLITQQNLTITTEAGQAPATISGGNLTRIFEVAPGASVTLSNLVLTGGNGVARPNAVSPSDGSGGAIVVDGSYSLTPGSLTISHCTVSGNSVPDGVGGAISNFGMLMVTDSTLAENSARSGGAILNMGTATVVNSTVQNSSVGYSGGLIYNDGVALTVSGSTLSTNYASYHLGGIINHEGTMTVTNSSVSGGIWDGTDTPGASTVNIYGSTISGGVEYDANHGTMIISGCTLTEGLYVGSQQGTYGPALVKVSNSTVSGGIYFRPGTVQGPLMVSGCTVNGGIYAYLSYLSTMTVSDSIVSGGIFNYSADYNITLTVNNSVVDFIVGNFLSSGGNTIG